MCSHKMEDRVMIEASHVLVRQVDMEDSIKFQGVLSIVVEHTELKSVELTNLDVQAKIEEAVRNSVLRYIFEDIVPIVHDMGKMTEQFLPTHLKVQMKAHMDHLMDIFLGLPPGKKH